MLDTPKLDVIVRPQIAYITGYVQQMEDAMYTDLDDGWTTRSYLNYIDRPSWVDYHILNVFVENVDAFVLSEYFSKDVNGLIVAGPVWDYDRSMGSADGRDSNPLQWSPTNDYTDWTVGWWGVIAQDPDFMQAWVDRWQYLRGNLFATANLTALVNSLAGQMGAAAAARDVARFPDDASRFSGGWSGEIANMSSWLTARAQWIDQQFVAPPSVQLAGGSRILTPAAGSADRLHRWTAPIPAFPGAHSRPSAQLTCGPVTLPSAQAYARAELQCLDGRRFPGKPVEFARRNVRQAHKCVRPQHGGLRLKCADRGLCRHGLGQLPGAGAPAR